MVDETTARLAEIIRAQGPAAAAAWLDEQIARSPDDQHLRTLRSEFAIVATAFAQPVGARPAAVAAAAPRSAPDASRGLSTVQRAAVAVICLCVVLLIWSPASGKSEFGQALGSRDRVFVPIRPESFLSLDQPLAAKGYGNVTVSDFKIKLVHRDGKAVAFTDDAKLPAGVVYCPMSPAQWVRAVREDREATGAWLDATLASGQSASKAELDAVLAQLPARPKVPLAVMVKRKGGQEWVAGEGRR